MEQQYIPFESDVSTIHVMLKQEESGYQVCDYLRNLPKSCPIGQPVDAIARSAIADWCVKIMDVCKYQRETAYVAISYLDRFMASPEGHSILLDRSLFQLAALASVYSAVKINEQQVLGSAFIAKLSNGERTSRDIEKMELRLLQALEWRVNPPTPMVFVQHHLALIPWTELDPLTRQAVIDLAQYQLNVCLSSYEFALEKASMVGLAALLNAADSISDDGSLLDQLESLILKVTGTHAKSLLTLRKKLYELISSKESSTPLSSLPTLRNPSAASLTAYMKTGRSYFPLSPRTVQL